MCSKLNHGLTYVHIRKLAYELAVQNHIPRPKTWDSNHLAGVDWMKGYMKRHTSLSLRTPEGTSLSRATSFNKTNITEFFDNLETVITRENFAEDDIWNIDETGYTTVQQTKKVVATKGQKQVGQVTSGERGQLVTICCAISASGRKIPPFMVFPRVNFKPLMIANAPKGTAGVAHISGWMNGENFILFLKHFASHVKCTKEKKVLLLMDNHESHITLKSLDYAKDNGIVLLTLPPHCSHKLQPLDIAVFSSFKNACDRAANDWMIEHPGQVITIYEIGGIVGKAFPIAFTAQNIMSGFKKSGIQPFNRNVFTDVDFLPAFVTDRPEPEQESEIDQQLKEARRSELSDAMLTNQPSTSSSGVNRESAHLESTTPALNSSFIISPKEVLPFPKAGARKKTTKGRKKLKSAIITDTPIKTSLEGELLAREEKKTKKNKSIKTEPKRKLKKIEKEKSPRIERVKRKVIFSSSSSEDDDGEISYDESDDCSGDEFDPEIEYDDLAPASVQDLKRGKFVVALFKGGKRLTTDYRYVCVVDELNEEDGEYKVVALKCMDKKQTDFILIETDISYVRFEDIIGIAPDPLIFMRGERIYYKFPKAIDVFEKA